MRLLICAGGTGGGVYPAIAVLQALHGETAGDKAAAVSQGGVSVLWVGSLGGMEVELVERVGVPFEAIPAAGVHGVGLRSLPGNLAQLWRGFWRARAILRRYRPDVLFFTGGYVAVPMALAGWKIPSLLYVPDIEPGMALKFLARFADRIALTAPDSRAFFGSRTDLEVTGYPVRSDLAAWDLDEARRLLGLSGDLPTLLVFGGSKGARSINRALLAVLPQLLEEMQVLHISGHLDWPEVESAQSQLLTGKRVSTEFAARYRPFPYLHAEMGAALTAADLVLARAGASTLGEFPHFGLPAILVPYPHAWRYQQVNARYLERHGAAMVLEDAGLGETLLPAVKSLIDDRSRREQMRQAMRSLAQPQAAQSISSLLQNLVARKGQERT
jgi:UDP-N-acetylglucosamine--N-acetylmuramyl-(pentapeptide) pyrophosphoryl-undecaprenol N-acetylglucosamine transferase